MLLLLQQLGLEQPPASQKTERTRNTAPSLKLTFLSQLLWRQW